MTDTKRHNLILINAAQLFGEQGVAVTTVREIADAVGLNSGSLYYYFPSKHAIVSEILVNFLSDLNLGYARVVVEKTSARESMRYFFRTFFEVVDRHPYAVEIYQSELMRLPSLPDYSQISAAVDTTRDAWSSAIKMGIRSGELRSDIGVFEMDYLLRSMLFAFARGHRTDVSLDVPRMVDILTSVALDGCALTSPGKEVFETLDHPLATQPHPRTVSLTDHPVDEIEKLRSELHALRSVVMNIAEDRKSYCSQNN